MLVRRFSMIRFILLGVFVAGLSGCGAVPSGSDGTPIDITANPDQKEINDLPPIRFTKDGYDWVITPKAEYSLKGVVLKRTTYRTGWNSILSPCDVAMAWGELAQGDLYKQLKWSQSNRWYFWKYGADFPKDNPFIIRYSSNTHIVPANPNLERAARSLKSGEPAELRGYLMRVDGKKGDETRWWDSSLSRTDEGDGSCELLYLKRLKADGKVYD
jgi:hypothetical protein